MNTLFVILGILVISNIIFIFKYLKIKKLTQSYHKIGTGRYGFYFNKHYVNNDKNSYVFVDEIDRYNNGYSEVKINKIEPFNIHYSNDAIKSAKDKFISLRFTTDITWLEGEDHLRKVRKEKLEKIKKS